jgi:hypothetical protein
VHQIFIAGRAGTSANALPFPSLRPLRPEAWTFSGWMGLSRRLIHYYPPLIYLLTLLYLIFNRGAEEKKTARAMLKILLAGVFVFQQDLRRTDVSHLMQAIAPAHLLFIILLSRLFDLKKTGTKMILVPVLSFFLAWLVAVDGYRFQYPNSILVRWNPMREVRLDRCRVKTHPGLASDLEDAVQFLKGAMKENESFLALPDIPIFYFLLDRNNQIPYEVIRRGHLASPEEESRLIEQIRNSNIQYLIYNRYELDDGRPERRLSNHAPRLSRYLNTAFVPVRTFNLFTVSRKIR